MTTVRKPDVTQTKSLHETAIVILYYLFTEDSGEDNLHHRNIKKVIEEPVHTDDDAEFTQEKIKNTIESFYHKKAPGLDGITGGIYQRMFHMFPRIITTIYNQCLKRGCFPKRWKIAEVIPVTKPANENSLDPSKYRPICFFKYGRKDTGQATY